MIYKNDNELRFFHIGRGKEAKEQKIHEQVIHRIYSPDAGKKIGETNILLAVGGFLDRNNDFLDNNDGRKRSSEDIQNEFKGICKVIVANFQDFSGNTKKLVSELFSLYGRDLEKDLKAARGGNIAQNLRFFAAGSFALGDGESVVTRPSEESSQKVGVPFNFNGSSAD